MLVREDKQCCLLVCSCISFLSLLCINSHWTAGCIFSFSSVWFALRAYVRYIVNTYGMLHAITVQCTGPRRNQCCAWLDVGIYSLSTRGSPCSHAGESNNAHVYSYIPAHYD